MSFQPEKVKLKPNPKNKLGLQRLTAQQCILAGKATNNKQHNKE
jgi:hypothetical protein